MVSKQYCRIILSFVLFSMSVNAFAYDARLAHPFSYYQQQYFDNSDKDIGDEVDLPKNSFVKSYTAIAKRYAKKMVKKSKGIVSSLLNPLKPLSQWIAFLIFGKLFLLQAKKLVDELEEEASNYPLLSKPYPSSIAAACEQMNYDPPRIFIADVGYLKDNAGASNTDGSLVVGKNFLDTLPESEINFVLGHEIAHIQKRHGLKTRDVLTITAGSLIALNIVMAIGILALEKYCNDHNCYRLKKIIPILKYLQASPLLYIALFCFVLKKTALMHEKEADITAALALNNAQGGISFFKRSIAENESIIKNRSFMQEIISWLNPVNIFLGIIKAHPSHQERIAYLSEIAKQQTN